MAHQYITAESLGKVILEALDIDYRTVQRLIIDCDVTQGHAEPVKIYLQMVGDARLLDIQWINALKGTDVITTQEVDK